MSAPDLNIFAVGYSDNASTSYLLNHLVSNGVPIKGVIFPQNTMTRSWSRLLRKIQSRGVYPTARRIFENQVLRRRQIARICTKDIGQVFQVEDVNSEQVRDILIANDVDVLILTATPIIKPILIDIEGLLILNAHTGWLPRYRGLDANLKAIRDGHQTGVSIHKVTEGIDAGEVYMREGFELDPTGNVLEQIDNKELELAGRLLVEVVRLRKANELRTISTEETLGVYEAPLTLRERSAILKRSAAKTAGVERQV